MPTELTANLGDTKTFTVPLRWAGRAFVPGTGDWGLIFTVKGDPATQADTDRLFQKSGPGDGLGLEVTGATALIEMLRADTYREEDYPDPGDPAFEAEPGTYYWDIQASGLPGGDYPGAARTVASGTLVLGRDVTRSAEPSGTIYTVEDPVFQGATTFAALTDKTTADLPAINTPLSTALALKAPLISPSFTTPTLGVATATSVNKITLTTPATGATITIADGKTLTASNTLTLAGTDGSTLNIGTGGTLATVATTGAYADLSGKPTLGTASTTAATDYAVADQGEIADERLAWARLWRWRQKLETSSYAPRIALIGDSMIGMPITQMRQHLWKLFGQGGILFMEPGGSGGATTLTTAYSTWYNGYLVRLSNTGHTATIGLNGGASAVEGDKMKLYYVTKPGGGTFKVQSTEDGSTWTDESGYTAVSSDGTLAGSIIDLTAKTTIRKARRLRAVWVSGGEVDIIGGAIYDTRSYGAQIALLAPQSNDLADNITASTAVMNPIFADMGIDMFVYSHFDGSQTDWAANQATFQNMVATASATTPTWLVIGPPAGEDDTQDAINATQAATQKALAETRGDAFWDNRRWAGTATQANAWGLQLDGDIHYEALAREQWISQCFEDVGLAMSNTRFPGVNEAITPYYSPQIRRSKNWTGGNFTELEITGNLRLCNQAGLTGFGGLVLEDQAGAVSYNDTGEIIYESNLLWLKSQGSKTFAFHLGGGYGPYTYVSGSTAALPLGVIGLTANPILEINVGKTIRTAGQVGDVTIDKTSGRVRFAAAADSLTVTCRHATANSVIIATVATDDTTAKSAVCVATAGSFVVKLNSAATAETAVNWWLIP